MLLTVPAPTETDAIPDGAVTANAVGDKVANSTVTPAPSILPANSESFATMPCFTDTRVVVLVVVASWVGYLL